MILAYSRGGRECRVGLGAAALALVLASAAGCGSGSGTHDGAATGGDASDAASDGNGATACQMASGSIRANQACDAEGTACPEDSAHPGRGTCTCTAGRWHCAYAVCPTDVYWGFMSDGSDCAYIDSVPAGCACASSYNPQQGHSYCLCTMADAGVGG